MLDLLVVEQSHFWVKTISKQILHHFLAYTSCTLKKSCCFQLSCVNGSAVHVCPCKVSSCRPVMCDLKSSRCWFDFNPMTWADPHTHTHTHTHISTHSVAWASMYTSQDTHTYTHCHPGLMCPSLALARLIIDCWFEEGQSVNSAVQDRVC